MTLYPSDFNHHSQIAFSLPIAFHLTHSVSVALSFANKQLYGMYTMCVRQIYMLKPCYCCYRWFFAILYSAHTALVFLHRGTFFNCYMRNTENYDRALFHCTHTGSNSKKIPQIMLCSIELLVCVCVGNFWIDWFCHSTNTHTHHEVIVHQIRMIAIDWFYDRI